MTNITTPGNEADMETAIKEARSNKQTVRILGGGSRQSLGQAIKTDISVSTEALRGIVSYDPGALSLVVKSGTPVSEVDAALAESNQRLAFEPVDHRSLLGTSETEPTIGGVVACGISGPRRIRVGACRDALLGVNFVNGHGDLIKNGGKVMKNVTGYDLVKFLCGSYGTLGVLTEMSFKTAPIPDVEATLIVNGLHNTAAISLLSKALGLPMDVTGAAHTQGETAKTYIRIEGMKDMVDTRLEKIEQILEIYSSQSEKPEFSRAYQEESHAIWRELRDASAFKNHTGDVWRVSLRPSEGPRFIEELQKEIECSVYYDWGGGLIWIGTQQSDQALQGTIRKTLSAYGGHATLVRSQNRTAPIQVFQPEPKALAALASRVKGMFDPDVILNPGLMLSEG